MTAMTKYRMSSHDLKIERARYNDPQFPMNQRICTICELSKIVDKKLLHCNAMNNEREILFNSIATSSNISFNYVCGCLKKRKK